MKRLAISLIALLGCAAFDWSDVTTPAPGPTQSIGFYSAGCIQGAKALPFDGMGYEAIRISRNR
jgi:penicillin-insensitive murein endopeptidase